MDIDISDILADISRPQPSTTSTLPPLHPHHPSATHTYDPQTAYTDHILLTRAWTSERCTPSLLPYPTTLITRVMDRLQAQISRIEDLTSGIYDGQTSTTSAPTNLNLTLSILQTDLSRTQFLLRSYLRQRLAKITKFAGYYSKHHSSSSLSSTIDNANNDDATDTDTDTKYPLLSLSEQNFLSQHTQILTSYYHSAFLSSLPPSLRRLDDSSGGTARMDQGPDMGGGVLVRCLAGEWGNEGEVEEGTYGEEGDGDGKEGERATVEVRCERGGVLVGRWRDVKGGVERGMLEVL